MLQNTVISFLYLKLLFILQKTLSSLYEAFDAERTRQSRLALAATEASSSRSVHFSQDSILRMLELLVSDNSGTPRTLALITDLIAAIDPSDLLFVVRARPVLGLVNNMLVRLSYAPGSPSNTIRSLRQSLYKLMTGQQSQLHTQEEEAS